MKIIFFIILIMTSLFAISSTHKFRASADILDMIIKNNTLYVSTVMGTVETFEIKTQKHKILLKLKPLINFFDEKYNARIYSIDLNENGDLLLLAEASKGRRKILIYKDEKLKEVSSQNCKKSYKEARFVGTNKILLVTLSNEVILYDIDNKKIIYSKSLSSYSFSDFSLNENIVAIASESGNVHMFDYENKKVIKILTGANKDNVYSVDYKNSTILTAGQDRVVGIYNMQSEKYKKVKVDFLVYACALSPDALRSAFMSNEDSQITVIDNKSLNVLATLDGHKSTVNRIIFYTNNHIFSSSDDGEILEWKIKDIR